MEMSGEITDDDGEEHHLDLKMPPHLYYILISILMVIIVLLTLYLPGIDVIFGFIGATTANLLAFILPAAFFLKMCSMEKGRAGKI